MNEHDYQPHPADGAECRATPPHSEDLDTRLFAVAHEQMRRMSEFDMEEAPTDDLDAALLRTALDALRRVAELGREHGDAFRAYLDVRPDRSSGVDPVADFTERYVGSWPDRAALIRDQVRERGWDAAIADLQVEWGMWPGDLKWDEGVLWDHLAETYCLSEQNGSVHAFRW